MSLEIGSFLYLKIMKSEVKKMKEKTNIIETGVVEVEITANFGAGEATQMNDDAEPINMVQ
jgi:hypothetical protein